MRTPFIAHRAITGLAVAALAAACAAAGGSDEPRSQEDSSADRKMVRSGDLVVAVDPLEKAAQDAERLVVQAGGFIEKSTITKETSVLLQCRVPAAQLDRVMGAVAALGDERRRTTSAADVTEQYADLETRLRNNLALRDRLRQLLSRATDVEDVLAIEKELNRIQSEIETMQARFDRLKSEVELSTLSITLLRKPLLGPLGYAAYGLWWVLSKLFVIR